MRFIVDEIKDKEVKVKKQPNGEYVFKMPPDDSPYFVNPDAYVLTNCKYVGNVDDNVKVKVLKNIICTNMNVTEEELLSKRRNRYIVDARHLFTYLIKQETDFSLSTIGRMIGGKDHATVLHSNKVWNNLLDTDMNYRIRTRTIMDKYMVKIWETEKDKTLILENEDIVANWELCKDKVDKKGNYLYR